MAQMRSATSAYLRLKVAQEVFKKAPGELTAPQDERLETIVARQIAIEQRILATPEAARVVLPESSLTQALAEIRGRYENDGEFRADMAKHGLDPERLAQAILGQLKVEAVLEQIGRQLGEVSDTDVELFYLMHRERFVRPETRTLRHLLVTINDALPGNERAAAQARITAIAARLGKEPRRFAEQAHKHSECPTALNGGQLGVVRRGQLYPELDTVAFELSAGEISAVVESPLGYHLLQCLAIDAAGELPLPSVSEQIRERIGQSRRNSALKRWIAGLFRQAAQNGPAVAGVREALT